MKAVVDQITAISRKSRDDGNQYWGRIPGTPYDRMTQDWVIDQFQKIGLKDVRRQDLDDQRTLVSGIMEGRVYDFRQNHSAEDHVPDQRNRRNTASRHQRAGGLGRARHGG